ncbi:MAG TPA: MFS transporter [Planktothrix sp.]|jgi:MFS family permease
MNLLTRNKKSATRSDKPPEKPLMRLTLFFAFAYVSHGLASQFGLIAQPLQYYMMRGLNMTAAQVSSYLAIMMLPWALKPLYGLVFDFVPWLGYRRKSYLVAVNLLAALSLGIMSISVSLGVVRWMLMLSAASIAASTALTVGVAVEEGRKDGKARQYFAGQTFWYYSAIIAASICGGFLCHQFAPEAALSTAAAVALVPPLLVSTLTLFTVKEERATFNREQLKQTLNAMTVALRSPALWLAALFIFCWDFSPSFGVPLYFYESNTLHFSQQFIGQLGAFNALGMVVGALVYRWLLQQRSVKQQLLIALAAGTVSTLAYVLISSEASAIELELARGLTTMVAILGIYGLAADVCPKGTEVSVMAALLAVRSLAMEGSTYLGGQLFTNVFHNHFSPLVLIAAATTAACAVLLPWLGTRQKVSEQ